MGKKFGSAVLLSLCMLPFYNVAEAVSISDFLSGASTETTTGTVTVSGYNTYNFDPSANGTLVRNDNNDPVLDFRGGGMINLNGNGGSFTVRNLKGGLSNKFDGAFDAIQGTYVGVNDLNLTVQRTEAGGLCLQSSNGSILNFTGGTLTLDMTDTGALTPADVTDINKKGIRGMKTYSDSSVSAGYIMINTDKFTNINTHNNIGLLLESQAGPIYVNSNLLNDTYNENAIIQLDANKIARVTGFAKDMPSSITLNLTNSDSYIKGMINTINREPDGGAVKTAEGLIRVLLQDGAHWTVTQGAKNKNDIDQNEYTFSNKVSRLTLTNKNTSQTGYVELASDGLGGVVTSLDVMKYDGNKGDINSANNLYGTFDMTSNPDHRVTIFSFIEQDAPYLLSSKGGNLRLNYDNSRSEYVEDGSKTYTELWDVKKYENNSDNLIVKVSDGGSLETAHLSSNIPSVSLLGDGTTLRVFNDATAPLTVKNLTMTGEGKIDLGTMFSELSAAHNTIHSVDTYNNEARAHILNVENLLAPQGLKAEFVQGTGLDTSTVETQDHQNVLASTANLKVNTINGDVNVRGNENQTLNLIVDNALTGNSTIVGNLVRATDNGGTEGMVVNADMQNGSWNMSADNRLNTLNFGAGGNIGYMTKAIGAFNTLSVADLTGSNGTFYYTSDLEDFTNGALDGDYSDIVKVTNGNDSGASYTLRFRDNIKGVVDHWYGGDGVRVLQGLTNKADITTFVAGTSILSTYNLLGEFWANEADPSKFDYVITNVKTSPTPSPVVQGGETLLTARILGHRLNQDTLLKRMGELHEFEGGEGLWARFRTSKMESAKYYPSETRDQYYEVGYDNRKDRKDGALKYTGVAFGYGKTTSTFNHNGADGYRYGHGDGDEKSLAYYDTWLGNKGHYYDLVARVGYLTNDMYLEDNFHNYKGQGDYHNWTYEVGVEYGRQIINKKNWFVEPQAQLTLGFIRGNEFNLGTDLAVRQNDYSSVIGRVGVVLGRKLDDVKYYAKVSGLHEFAGRGSYDFLQVSTGGKRHEDLELGGTWGEVGIGVNAKLSKETFANFDIEKTFGSADYKTPWRVNASLRWEF